MPSFVKLLAAASIAALLAACASAPAPVEPIEAPPAKGLDAKTTLENGS